MLNLVPLLNPLPVNQNEISATLPGTEKLPVIVRRRAQGWTVYLEIIIDGKSWHLSDANESDREQFNELMNRAHTNQQNMDDEKRTRVNDAARAVKLWAVKY